MENAPLPLRKSDAKILLVDDRADNLMSIEAILEKDNYTIVKANSGKAALKVLLNDHDFSLILMDVQMPDLNGYETATIIYERVKLLNEKLVANNESLKQMNEELDQFAYMASHDLQEPLRKIQVFSDKILRNNNFDPESEKYFGKIINSSKRMQSLINNLLDFSRHTVSSNDFKKTSLNDLVKNVLTELEVEIEKSNAQINYENLPVVSAVPGLMQQLFYNLFSNAIKFRKPAVDLVIDVKAEKINPVDLSKFTKYGQGKNYYKISVKDNGIGFDDKYAEDIFRVFKRLHSYQEFEGTGVGLSICKKIVEKHNGFIRAESKIDNGSTFIIGLPEMQMAN